MYQVLRKVMQITRPLMTIAVLAVCQESDMVTCHETY